MVHPRCHDSCAETPFWVEHEMAPPVQRDTTVRFRITTVAIVLREELIGHRTIRFWASWYLIVYWVIPLVQT